MLIIEYTENVKNTADKMTQASVDKKAKLFLEAA
jgi:hypothetical protein